MKMYYLILHIPLLESCKNVIGKAVKDSGFSASELDSLILVGGSSKMPVLQHYLSDALNIPVLKEEKHGFFSCA